MSAPMIPIKNPSTAPRLTTVLSSFFITDKISFSSSSMSIRLILSVTIFEISNDSAIFGAFSRMNAAYAL